LAPRARARQGRERAERQHPRALPRGPATARPRVVRSSLALLAFSMLAACGDGGERMNYFEDGGVDDGAMPGDDAAHNTDAAQGDGSIATVPEVSPTCVDGQYTETLPNPSASVSTLVAGYSAGSFKTFVHD